MRRILSQTLWARTADPARLRRPIANLLVRFRKCERIAAIVTLERLRDRSVSCMARESRRRLHKRTNRVEKFPTGHAVRKTGDYAASRRVNSSSTSLPFDFARRNCPRRFPDENLVPHDASRRKPVARRKRVCALRRRV